MAVIDDQSRPYRAALLSLVPDSGHVIPLLRIGQQLQSAGVEVCVFCPDEAEPLVRQAGLTPHALGRMRPADYTAALAQLIAASDLSRRLYAMRRFESRYTAEVQATALARLDEVVTCVHRWAPDVLVTDDHLFAGTYKLVAERCRVPLVLNYSAGSSYRILDRQRWSREPPRKRAVVRAVARAVGWLTPRLERACLPARYWHKRRRTEQLESHWQRCEALVGRAVFPTYSVAAGTIALEDRYLRGAIPRHSELRAFPMIEPVAVGPLGEQIGSWLDRRPGEPVVYICFGTMAPTRFAFADRLISAVLGVGARVLWAGPTPPAELGRYAAEQVRWEKWVPQVAVLQHPAVRAFVSHAGAGSVQEALWFGKPLVCVPLVWDQPYNGWVAEQLGFGVCLDRRSLSLGRMAETLQRVLFDSALHDRAQQLSAEMRALSADGDLAHFIQAVASTGHDEASISSARVS